MRRERVCAPEEELLCRQIWAKNWIKGNGWRRMGIRCAMGPWCFGAGTSQEETRSMHGVPRPAVSRVNRYVQQSYTLPGLVLEHIAL
jgi:hypothetical protein